MNKYYIMVSLLLSTSLLVSAGPKQKKVDNWIDASVKQKSELRASLVKANMPFFKQKTAYEITYGDWSSDVCSSDLCRPSSDACI